MRKTIAVLRGSLKVSSTGTNKNSIRAGDRTNAQEIHNS